MFEHLGFALSTNGVDRISNRINGVIVAEVGEFKTPGRGQFDKKSLEKIIRLWPVEGLKARWGHPANGNDGIGSFLGRYKSPRIETVVGRYALRSDLHLDPTAFKTPMGNIGGYLMDLAASDPSACSCSLVLETEKEQQLDAKGRQAIGKDGRKKPPLWRPTGLYALDVVDRGEATTSLLCADGDNSMTPAALIDLVEVLEADNLA